MPQPELSTKNRTIFTLSHKRESRMICRILIDYDNLLKSQKESGILDIVTRIITQCELQDDKSQIRCDVRVYGGWYEGDRITRIAQDLTIEIQRDFPHSLRINDIFISLTAELAMAMLEEPDHHLFNTYRIKGKPRNVHVEKPEDIGCTDPNCLLPLVKKMLRTGKCTKSGCSVSVKNLLYRVEQKIVDTMMTCDLIYVATDPCDTVVLVSGDDDFLPPLRTILLRGQRVVRVHPKPSNQRLSFTHPAISLTEMDL